MDNLIFIDDTASQLETALKVSELICTESINEAICFANIDTIVAKRVNFFNDLSKLERTEALVDTFSGSSSKYSFARVDDNASISEVVDNSVISDFACSGLYGFGSFKIMKNLAIRALAENYQANFTYLLNSYISAGYKVKNSHAVVTGDTVVLGTPEEYLINIHRFTR